VKYIDKARAYSDFSFTFEKHEIEKNKAKKRLYTPRKYHFKRLKH
jgi:hypothetical protein